MKYISLIVMLIAAGIVDSVDGRYLGDVHEVEGKSGRRLAAANEYILTFQDRTKEECNTLKQEIQEICTRASLRGFGVNSVQAEASATPLLTKCFVTVKGSQECLDEITEEVPGEFGVEPNYIVHSLQNPLSWGLNRIDQESLPLSSGVPFDTAFTGAGINVYIADTGILATHNDFGGRTRYGGDFIGEGFDEDRNGHGTHCAGTAAGSQYGVARDANIIGVKVLSAGGSGTLAGVIAGIEWAVTDANGAAGVISMSLGGGFSQSMNDATTEAAVNGNMIVVVAAGNENQDCNNVSPASAGGSGMSGGVLTVGSTTSSDARSSFSNYGSCVDIFAPGSGITSAWCDSNTDTKTISGTSMATPHVAGVAATLLEKHNGDKLAAQQDLLSSAAQGKISGVNGSPNLLLQTETYTGPPTLPPPPTPAPTQPPSHSPQRICITNQEFCAEYETSQFGAPMPVDEVIQGPLVVAEEDPILCSDPSSQEAARFAGKVVLVSRGECLFFDKVKRAENAGALAVIIHMAAEGDIFPPGYYGDDTTELYSAMISLSDGETFKAREGDMVVFGSDTAMGPPTFQPTKAPTGPTVPPTFSPTSSPTLPTAAPTLAPTLAPTGFPTVGPKNCESFRRWKCRRNSDQCVWGFFGGSRRSCVHIDETPPPTPPPTFEEDETCPSGGWSAGQDYCAAKGKRLCSVRDLIRAPEQPLDSCLFDSAYVWTGQRCRRGRRWVVMRDSKRRRCRRESENMGFRCCD